MENVLPAQFQTERLLLRAPRKEDARVLFDSYTQDIEVARYMVWRPHASIAQTEAFVAECIHAWDNGLRKPYVLALRGGGHHAIGMLEARILGHVVDIGYVLAREHWGAGLMPEAVRALTELALSRPGLFRVQASCDIDNRPSARTLEKSGFVREGRLDRYTVHPKLGTEPRPCFMYARCR